VKANFSTFGAVFLNYYSPTSRYVNDVNEYLIFSSKVEKYSG
jgi:hypothetical protein